MSQDPLPKNNHDMQLASEPHKTRTSSQVEQGLAIGAALGVALGAALGNVVLGLILGVAVGAALGSERAA